MIGRVVIGCLTGVAGLGAVAAVSGEDDTAAERGVMVVVVDGDTVRLPSGDRVRLIGIDAPERGECGYQEATRHLRGLLDSRPVVLRNPGGVDDTDRYDRLLRFVEVGGGQDAGRAQLEAGLAEARYDSRDGYDRHPRQDRYLRAEARAVPRCAERPEVRVEQSPEPETDVEDPAERPEVPSVDLPDPEPAPPPPPPAPPTDDFTPPAGYTTDALTPGYTGCRQGYPGGLVDGVYVWKPISC